MQQLSIISRQQLILTSPPIQPVKKDRKEYFKQRYQTKKHYWEENYMSKKSQTKEATKKQEKEQMGRYHHANNIKVLMSLKEYNEYAGVWKDPKTNIIYLDITVWMKDEEEAMKLAREKKQLAIWDIKNQREIWIS